MSGIDRRLVFMMEAATAPPDDVVLRIVMRNLQTQLAPEPAPVQKCGMDGRLGKCRSLSMHSNIALARVELKSEPAPEPAPEFPVTGHESESPQSSMSALACWQ